MLRELAREHEPDRCLDLTAGEGLLLAVAAELGGLERDAFEDVVEPTARARRAGKEFY